MQWALRVLLMLQCLGVPARTDVPQQELQKWVNDSTLIFKGTTAVDGNVDSITASDYPITVKAARVELDPSCVRLCEANEAVRLEQHR